MSLLAPISLALLRSVRVTIEWSLLGSNPARPSVGARDCCPGSLAWLLAGCVGLGVDVYMDGEEDRSTPRKDLREGDGVLERSKEKNYEENKNKIIKNSNDEVRVSE